MKEIIKKQNEIEDLINELQNQLQDAADALAFYEEQEKYGEPVRQIIDFFNGQIDDLYDQISKAQQEYWSLEKDLDFAELELFL